MYPPIKSIQKGGFPASEFCLQIRLLNCHCIKLECIICTSLATFGTMEIIGLLRQSRHLVPGNFLQYDSVRVKLVIGSDFYFFFSVCFIRKYSQVCHWGKAWLVSPVDSWGKGLVEMVWLKGRLQAGGDGGVVLCLPTHNCSAVIGLLIEVELCVSQVFNSDWDHLSKQQHVCEDNFLVNLSCMYLYKKLEAKY